MVLLQSWSFIYMMKEIKSLSCNMVEMTGSTYFGGAVDDMYSLTLPAFLCPSGNSCQPSFRG